MRSGVYLAKLGLSKYGVLIKGPSKQCQPHILGKKGPGLKFFQKKKNAKKFAKAVSRIYALPFLGITIMPKVRI